jgi:hypothetical protein
VPGQFVTLWGTGLAIASTGTSGWTVDVAGTSVTPSFVGTDGQGLDQINFKMPANPPLGCYVPVTLIHGDTASNPVTLSINTTPGACAHPFGLSYGDLLGLDQGEFIGLGQIELDASSIPAATGTVSPTKPVQSVDASFGSVDSNSLYAVAGPQLPYDQFFGCHAVRSPGPILAGSNGIGGNAGDTLTLAGPDGKQLRVPAPSAAGFYSLQIPDANLPFFSGGSWSVSAPGNSVIGAFQKSFTLPPPLTGLNRDELGSLRTGDDVTVRWNNQGYGINDIATLTAVGTSGETICRTYAFLGTFTLPKNTVGATGGTVNVSISPAPYARTQFTVPLIYPGAAAGSVEQTVVNYRFSDLTILVTFH